MFRGGETLLDDGEETWEIIAPEGSGVEPEAGEEARTEEAVGIGGMVWNLPSTNWCQTNSCFWASATRYSRTPIFS